MATKLRSPKARFFIWSAERASGQFPREDSVFADSSARVFVVADGVTRSHSKGKYPEPSPARDAANIICETIKKHVHNSLIPADALSEANQDIKRLNTRLGLSVAAMPEGDLAGAVAAVAYEPEPGTLSWAYLGDCGIALIDKSGRLCEETSDEIAEARRFFPKKPVEKERRRFLIHSELRNNPKRTKGGYGVLTGQEGALDFVRSGTWPTAGSWAGAVFSDGFRPFLRRGEIRRLLIEGLTSPSSRRQLGEACDRLRISEPSTYGDEATVAVWCTDPG